MVCHGNNSYVKKLSAPQWKALTIVVYNMLVGGVGSWWTSSVDWIWRVRFPAAVQTKSGRCCSKECCGCETAVVPRYVTGCGRTLMIDICTEYNRTTRLILVYYLNPSSFSLLRFCIFVTTIAATYFIASVHVGLHHGTQFITSTKEPMRYWYRLGLSVRLS